MKEQVLVSTVGGSHEPIVTAVREMAPAFICFLCTDKDPVTGQRGSRVQIEGQGNVIKAHPNDETPSLPNIPVQCELKPVQYGVWIVPADDLASAVRVIRQAIAELKARFPSASIVADYTGGTKTMTAALVMTAVEIDGVDLQIVTGARADLRGIRGHSFSTPVEIERMRTGRAIALYLAAWSQYGYGAAAAGLESVRAPHDHELRAELQIARDLSRAFDAWDRFDHAAAERILRVYDARLGRKLGPYFHALTRLTGSRASIREAWRLLDLWLNALRCERQRRFDDAVARVYRLLEWTAQWVLRERHGIDTANVPADMVPAGVDLSPDRRGNLQAGLYAAWQLIAHLDRGSAGAFAADQLDRMRDRIQVRNESILAHGFTPITKDAWRSLREWLESAFVPALLEETARVKIDRIPEQLPVRPLWWDETQ